MRTNEKWEDIIEIANLIRKILNEKPQELKIGYSVSPGGILNAYREGDLSFDEAVSKLKQIQLEPFRTINPLHPERVMENLETLVRIASLANEMINQIREREIRSIAFTKISKELNQTLSAMKEGA